jgi:uncharacterized membrane protein YhaH (DUF805 family)
VRAVTVPQRVSQSWGAGSIIERSSATVRLRASTLWVLLQFVSQCVASEVDICLGGKMSDWQYQRDGKASEPVSDVQLKALAEARVINASTLVWRPDFPNWKPIAETDFQYKSALQPPPLNAAFASPSQFQGQYRAVEGLSLFAYFTRALSKKYVDFEGRARRKEYWGYQLFYTLILLALLLVGLMLDFTVGGVTMEVEDDSVPMVTTTFLLLFILGTFLPSLAITVRRMHDIGVSGWIYLVALVPYIGGFVIFVMSVIPSQAGTNTYGRSPKEHEDLDVAAAFN